MTNPINIKDVQEFKESLMLQLELQGVLANSENGRRSKWRVEEAKRAIDIVLQLETEKGGEN